MSARMMSPHAYRENPHYPGHCIYIEDVSGDSLLCHLSADAEVHSVKTHGSGQTGVYTGEGYDPIDFGLTDVLAQDHPGAVGALAEPALPYAGTSGWSGSETSRSTAVDEDNDGRTLDKQQKALRAFDTHNTYGQGEDAHYIGRSYGLTWRELDTLTSWGHGSTSRVLSDLHKAGLLARLSEVRNRCKVYVLPEYVAGRETEPHGGRGGDRLTDADRMTVRQAADEAEVNYHGLEVTELLTDLLNIIDRLAPEPKVKQATDEGHGDG